MSPTRRGRWAAPPPLRSRHYNPQPKPPPPLEIVEPVEEIASEDELEIPIPLAPPEPPPAENCSRPNRSLLLPLTEPEIDFGQTEKQTKGEPDGQTRQGPLVCRHSWRAGVAAKTGHAVVAQIGHEEGNVASRRPPPSPQTEARRPSHRDPSDGSRHPAEVEEVAVTVSFENDGGSCSRRSSRSTSARRATSNRSSVNLSSKISRVGRGL